jgi:hypothetical protein
MPTVEARQRRDEVDRKLARLRYQFIFLFVFLVLVSALATYLLRAQANRIEYGRYDTCVERFSDIVKYNASISPSGIVPDFPLPKCGENPRTD